MSENTPSHDTESVIDKIQKENFYDFLGRLTNALWISTIAHGLYIMKGNSVLVLMAGAYFILELIKIFLDYERRKEIIREIRGKEGRNN